MKTIQFKITSDEEELVKMATSNNKNRYLLDYKMVYMDAVKNALRLMMKK
jgi:hypothetical protein